MTIQRGDPKRFQGYGYHLVESREEFYAYILKREGKFAIPSVILTFCEGVTHLAMVGLTREEVDFFYPYVEEIQKFQDGSEIKLCRFTYVENIDQEAA